jgi:uncharacterized membrane protein
MRWLLVTFNEESKAYQAASVLKQADAEGRIGLDEVAVVQRMEEGTLRVKEGDADAFPLGTWTTGLAGAASGGIIGLTLGTLGGPLGLLLGGSYGAMLGSLFDLGAEEEDESVLAKMARTIKPGTTALVAAVTEPAVEEGSVSVPRLVVALMCLALITVAVSVSSIVTLAFLTALLCGLAAFETAMSGEFRRELRTR